MKRIKGVKIVRQLEPHNVAILKKRFDYFRYLPKYQRLAGVLLELKELKYSRLELGAAFLPPKYLHPTTHVMNTKGKINLDTMIRALNRDQYKVKYNMLQVYFILFVGKPDEETGIAEGSYLVTPMTSKTIPEVVKRLEAVYEGIERSILNLKDLKSTNKRTVEKELRKYHQQLESKLIRTKYGDSY